MIHGRLNLPPISTTPADVTPGREVVGKQPGRRERDADPAQHRLVHGLAAVGAGRPLTGTAIGPCGPSKRHSFGIAMLR